MGIKFLCPNGHKLHVKSFLAGKRAICPKCGERVVVPSADASDASDLGSVTDVGSVSIEIQTAPELAATERAVNEAPAISTAETGLQSPASADPIAESPTAVWYVRPSTGGQFGPASGEIMQTWVREGRVGASSLVWRAGWEQWRSASEVFPQLSALLTAPAAVPSGSGAMPSIPQGKAVPSVAPASPPTAADGATSPLPQAIRKRRRRNEVSLMASGVLLTISVILVIVLFLVFRYQSAPRESESSGPNAEQQ